MIRVGVPIPTVGRLPALLVNIARLKQQRGVECVPVIIGNEAMVQDFCEENGVPYIQHENILGAKWNAGFSWLRDKCDYVLYVGSCDFPTDSWCETMIKHLENNGADMVGKKDFYMLDISMYGIRRGCYWSGYDNSEGRINETIGCGRVLSAGILDKIDWQPFNNDAVKSMDWTMQKKVDNAGGKTVCVVDGSIHCLSFSCHKWAHMHAFNRMYYGRVCKQIPKDDLQYLISRYWKEFETIDLNYKPKESVCNAKDA
jgi:hypothetical protein